jgi:hypothetical protein
MACRDHYVALHDDATRWRTLLSTSLEGRLDINLTLHADVLGEISVRSSRPRLAQKLMAGLTPLAAAERAGLIFSLCGKAQRTAAEVACEAALGIQPEAEVEIMRVQRVLIELAQEHAWHFLLHWPQQVAEAADMASLFALRKSATDPTQFSKLLEQLLNDVFLGESAMRWLTQDLTAFDFWREQAATLPAKLFRIWDCRSDHGISQAQLLPPLHQLDPSQCAELARQALANEDFCGQPEWSGGPAETGAIARQWQHPLLAAWIDARGRGAGARLLARLIELASLPQQLAGKPDAVVKAVNLGENIGMSAIESSRGLLIHVVRLANEKIVDYRIVAPTEWNFHPAGALVEALTQAMAVLAPDEVVAKRAEAICQSLDPCVSFAVEVSHA